jgi:pentose-5-phosphate-3-epimerase
VLVLTVEPGFGGQSFMKEVVQKCRVLRRASATLHIEVGGWLVA